MATLRGGVEFTSQEAAGIGADPKALQAIADLIGSVMPEATPEQRKTKTFDVVRAAQSVGQGEIGPIRQTATQRLMTDAQAVGVGLVKGFVPRSNAQLRAPIGAEDWAAPAGEGIGAVTSNILGALFTGGVYNAWYGAAKALADNTDAQNAALRANDADLYARLADSTWSAMGTGAAANFALSKTPGAIGKGPTTKALSALGMGYGADVAMQAQDQYARTGQVDASAMIPGIATVFGPSVALGAHYAPQLAQVLRLGAKATGRATQEAFSPARGSGLRAASRGRIGFGGEPPVLKGRAEYTDLERTVPTRQRGEWVGRHNPMKLSQMQQDANAAVSEMLDAGKGSEILYQISAYEHAGEGEQAQALMQAALAPGNVERLPAGAKDLLEAYRKMRITSSARALALVQQDPIVKAKMDLLDAALDGGSVDIAEEIHQAGELVKTSITDAYGAIMQAMIENFKRALAALEKNVEKPGARYRKTGEVKPKVRVRLRATKQKPFELKVQVVDEAKVAEAIAADKRKALEKALASEAKKKASRRVSGDKQLKLRLTPKKETLLKLKLQVVDEAKVAEEALAAKKKELEDVLIAEAKKNKPRGPKVRQLKLALGSVEREQDRIKRALARVLADDPTIPREVKPRPAAQRSPEEQAVLDFIRERSAAKAYIRRKLGTDKRAPKAPREYKFTAIERKLLAKVEEKRLAEIEARKAQLKLKPPRIRAARARRQARADVAKAQEALRRKAMTAIARLERQLNVQTKLPLKIPKNADQTLVDALKTLSPEMQAYFYELTARKTASVAFDALDRRLRAMERPRVSTTRESLAAMIERLRPQMTPAAQAQLDARVTAIEKRRFLRSYEAARTPSKRTAVTLLDRLLQAHKFDLLTPNNKSLVDAIMERAKRSVIELDSKDWATLNELVAAASDASLDPYSRRVAVAAFQHFVADRTPVHPLARLVHARSAGLLLQLATQTSNIFDGALMMGYFKGPYGLFRGVGESVATFAMTRDARAALDRLRVLKISDEVKAYRAQNQTSLLDELKLTLHDLKTGDNTQAANLGDVYDVGGYHVVLPRKWKGVAQADAVVRAATSGLDRMSYRMAFLDTLDRELELIWRAGKREGLTLEEALPAPGSDEYKAILQTAADNAQYVTYTTPGIATAAVGGIRKGFDWGVDAIGRSAGLLKKGQSFELGSLLLPFIRVSINAPLRAYEMLPGIGLLGGGANRVFWAATNPGKTGGKFVEQAAGQLVASQIAGLLLYGGSQVASRYKDAAYWMGYYYTYDVPDPTVKMSSAKRDVREGSGYAPGTINVDAIGRYLASANPEDLAQQQQDRRFFVANISALSNALLFLTSDGRRDRPLEERNAMTAGVDTARDVIMANDATRGINRIVNNLTQARDPETGETGNPWAGVAKEAADVMGFKIPGQDLLPRTIPNPQSMPQLLTSRMPQTPLLGDLASPPRLDAEGDPKVIKGLLQSAPEGTPIPGTGGNYSRFMLKLANTTGSEAHLLGPIARTLTAEDDEGKKVEVRLTNAQRYAAEKTIKPQYAEAVAKAAAIPRFATLPPEEQVTVLSGIRRDIIHAYQLREFKAKMSDKAAERARAYNRGLEVYWKYIIDAVKSQAKKGKDQSDF